MKVAFMGTPEFAIPILRALTENFEVVCVVTVPDRPVGRGKQIVFSPVKQFALEHDIPLVQTESISKELHLIDLYKPDVIITAAFGQILKQNVLDYCKHGVVNVHGSLLPRYRGGSCVQHAILNGDTETGATIMQTDKGLDTGDIILQKSITIEPDETAGELTTRLSELGAVALVEALNQMQTGKAVRVPQDSALASYFPLLKKEDGRIDFSKSPNEIHSHIRAMHPWPCAFFERDGQQIKVHKAKINDGVLELLEIQLPGKTRRVVLNHEKFV